MNEEAQIQKACISFIDKYYPEIGARLFSIPNESPTNYRWGNKLNDMGRRKGAWDCFLSVATKQYAGLYIEFKTKTGSLTPEQRSFQNRIGSKYAWAVVRDPQQFYNAISRYLSQSPGPGFPA